jgi:hypothetical protein
MTAYTFPLLDRIQRRGDAAPDALAIYDKPRALRISYRNLLDDVAELSSYLLSARRVDDLKETRVMLLSTKGYLVPLGLLSIWAAGGVALPVIPGQPLPEQTYQIENSGADIILVDDANMSRAEELQNAMRKLDRTVQIYRLAIPEHSVTERRKTSPVAIGGDRRALLLYTSGTVSLKRVSTILSVDRQTEGRGHEAHGACDAGQQYLSSVAMDSRRKLAISQPCRNSWLPGLLTPYLASQPPTRYRRCLAHDSLGRCGSRVVGKV